MNTEQKSDRLAIEKTRGRINCFEIIEEHFCNSEKNPCSNVFTELKRMKFRLLQDLSKMETSYKKKYELSEID